MNHVTKFLYTIDMEILSNPKIIGDCFLIPEADAIRMNHDIQILYSTDMEILPNRKIMGDCFLIQEAGWNQNES